MTLRELTTVIPVATPFVVHDWRGPDPGDYADVFRSEESKPEDFRPLSDREVETIHASTRDTDWNKFASIRSYLGGPYISIYLKKQDLK